MPRAATRQNHGTYTFQRGLIFWARFHSPAGTWKDITGKDDGRYQRSLGTSDPIEAKRRAGALEQIHLAALQAKRPQFVSTWETEFEPGPCTKEGAPFFATPKELFPLDAAGKVCGEPVPNGRMVHRQISGDVLPFGDASRTGSTTVARLRSVIRSAADYVASADRPAASATENPDDQLLENYLKRGGKNRTGVQPSKQAEAKAVWTKFKELTNNKRLKDCKAADAALLVEYYQKAKNKSATVHKKLVWLSAMVNHAIFEGELDSDYRNPFMRAAPHLDDATDRSKGFNAADLAKIRAGLDKLDDKDKLLVRWLACTGARLSEISTVDKEMLSDDGIRYMHIGKKPGGKKTDASVRDLPLPIGLPGFPDKIDGPYFGDPKGASKRLNKFLKDVGVWVKQEKVVHSFRHTATTHLRDAGYSEDWIDALEGHASPLYGKYNLPKFQEMISKIGI